MRRNAIPFNTLFQLAKEFCTEKELDSKKKEREVDPLFIPYLLFWLCGYGKQCLNFPIDERSNST